MTFARIVALALLTGSGIVSGAQAQSLRSAGPPAEFPPASYKGTQYVDSRGCAYIRAGIDGNTTWVPRVSRSRTAVCNLEPTVINGQKAGTAPAPQTGPEIITLEEPEPTPPAKVARVKKAQPASKPTPKPRVTKAPKPAPKPPVTVAAAQPKPVARPAVKPVKRVRKSACPDASVTSQAYINSQSDRLPVRCGSQDLAVFDRAVRGDEPLTTTRRAKTQRAKTLKPRATAKPVRKTAQAAVPSTSLPGSTRVVPKHVAEARANVGDFMVPDGYRPAWRDDRLNPKRAEGTLAGRDRMNLIWTNTVPRRLIDRSSGKDVTAKVALVYPYLDADTQARELGNVSLVTKSGKVMKRIVRNPKPAKPVYSTRSATQPKSAPKPARTTPKAQAQGRYIQVGLFGVAENATKTAARLKAKGLPAKISKLTRGGTTYRSVVVGPLAAQNTSAALSAVRRAGFKDAYMRK